MKKILLLITFSLIGCGSDVEKCVESVCKYIGLPTPTNFYKKFMLKVSGHYEVNVPKKVKMEFF